MNSDLKRIHLPLRIYFTFLFLLIANLILAQAKLCPDSENKKAKKYFEQALDSRKKGKPYKTIKSLIDQTLSEDSSYVEAWKILGDVSYFNKDYLISENAYQKATDLCPDIGPNPFYRLGILRYQKKDFIGAEKAMTTFLDFNKVKDDEAKYATEVIYKSRLLAHPVPFNPKPLKGVSTNDPEYLACISPDGDFCFFTRRYEMLVKGLLTPVSVEKFMVSPKNNNEFQKGEPMPFPFNKKQNNNEGSPSISIDNKYLFFTENNNGNFDLYMSEAFGSGWKDPVPVFANKNDNDYWEGQPSISPDGNTLYFASYRDSVTQTGDIYISKKVNGKWASPELLSGPINTSGNEKSPFIHPDNRTLYFSSNGLPGMGGYDIFISRLDTNGNWSAPLNLGYPVNTEADEVGFFVSTDGQHGYFASNNINSTGGYDIFEFALNENVKPEKVLFIKGELKNDEEDEPLNANIELKNAVTKETITVNYDSVSGRYASVVLFNQDYILTVKKKGYAFSSAYFSNEDTTLNEPVKVDLDLIKNKKGKAYTLNNILFETNSAVLSRQDRVIIDQFSDYLKLNPEINVAINGHTDNEGNPADNLLLSEKRAQSVYDYLITTGILKDRLSYHGYGETQPIQPNDKSSHKAQNRRTEFVIVNL